MLRLLYKDRKKIKTLAARAEELEQSNRSRGAARVYTKICRLDPENPRWPRKAGDALRRLGRNRQAVRTYEQAIALHMSIKQDRHALALCQLVLNLDPDNAEVRRIARRLQATSRIRSQEQERRQTERLAAENRIPQTEPGWPSVGDFTTPFEDDLDVARVQAQAIREAAASGKGLATWYPPETTPMVDISSEISNEEIVAFDPLNPTCPDEGFAPLEILTNTEAEPRPTNEMETLPVADDPFGSVQDSLDDIPIIVDLPPGEPS